MENSKLNTGSPSQLLLILQHPSTFTAGRRIKPDVNSPTKMRNCKLGLDAEVAFVDRGGEWTYHGPGQLVVYPLVNLDMLGLTPRSYIKSLENSIIDTCNYFGLDAETNQHTGVWIKDRKVGAIGVSIKRRWCMHGFSLNVNNDLSWFDMIVACGIKDKTVTSLSNELGRNIKITDTISTVLTSIQNRWNCQLSPLVEDTELAASLNSFIKDN